MLEAATVALVRLVIEPMVADKLPAVAVPMPKLLPEPDTLVIVPRAARVADKLAAVAVVLVRFAIECSLVLDMEPHSSFVTGAGMSEARTQLAHLHYSRLHVEELHPIHRQCSNRHLQSRLCLCSFRMQATTFGSLEIVTNHLKLPGNKSDL